VTGGCNFLKTQRECFLQQATTMDPQQQRAGVPQRGPPPQTGDISPILTVVHSSLAHGLCIPVSLYILFYLFYKISWK